MVWPCRKKSAADAAARLCAGEKGKADKVSVGGKKEVNNDEAWMQAGGKEKTGQAAAGKTVARESRKSKQLGRSMIEMLGVLAIIGVLSVASIAAYSQAMEKVQLNKFIREHSEFFYNLVEHSNELHILARNTRQQVITNTIAAMDIVPETWQKSPDYLVDSTRSYVTVTIAPAGPGLLERISVNIFLGGYSSDEISGNFSAKLCSRFFTDLLIPSQNVVYNAHLYRQNAGFTTSWYGENTCFGRRNCLSNMTLNDVRSICSMCDTKNDACAINFNL